MSEVFDQLIQWAGRDGLREAFPGITDATITGWIASLEKRHARRPPEWQQPALCREILRVHGKEWRKQACEYLDEMNDPAARAAELERQIAVVKYLV